MDINRTNYTLITFILQRANKIQLFGKCAHTDKEISKTKKISTVRSLLSRNMLIENGISCPEIYEAHILLMPKYYLPNSLEKN